MTVRCSEGARSASARFLSPLSLVATATVAVVCASTTAAAAAAAVGAPPVDVFRNGEAVPGLPHPEYTYGFQIPVLVDTTDPAAPPGGQRGALVAFAQAYVRKRGGSTAAVGAGDGNDGWIDVVARRSLDGGATWDANLTVVLRNSSLATGEVHSCQQPAPVVDWQARKIFLLTSVDNWHMRLQESSDGGATWTPWAEARDLDDDLRRPGWGLVFAGLPGGVQLREPNPHAGRLVVCSSAYWSGGRMGPDGRVEKPGDPLSRYSYTILSDDHGATWRIGSGQIEPRHTTECSVAQSFDGDGKLFLYTRVWDKTCEGCEGYGRGIAASSDGGVTWDNATLRGLPDTAPDCEGSFASALVGANGGANGANGVAAASSGVSCFYVSAPDGPRRANLTLRRSCGGIDAWEPAVVVDPGSSSYSSVRAVPPAAAPAGAPPSVWELWAWSNTSASPNACMSAGGLKSGCVGGIRFAAVTFPPPPPAAAALRARPFVSGTARLRAGETRLTPRASEKAVAPAVMTEQGRVVGWTRDGVDVFRGVPYARPPLGDLRLRPPAEPGPYPGGTLSATAFAPTCLQDHGWPSEQGANTSSEDCLYLNVYVPHLDNGGSRLTPSAGSAHRDAAALPVMVYYPAGEFLIGSANDLENNWPFSPHVVLVTVGYRLGWLGFAALDALRHRSPVNATGNYGMEDQRAALAWLRRNAAAFGGDPSRVTIFGESSGGSSVAYHLANPRSWGLFHRAVGESPGLTQVRSLADATDNTEYLLAVLAHNRSARCEQQSGGPLREFNGTRISSKPTRELASCDESSTSAACVADAQCFGFSAARTAAGGLANCTFHAVGAPTYGGDLYANWTTFVKPATLGDGAAEACLLAANATQLVRGGLAGRNGPHTSDLLTDLWAPVVDGVELNRTMLDVFAAGAVAPGVDVAMGANKDEASTWMHDVEVLGAPLACGNTTPAGLLAWARDFFGDDVGARLPALYADLDAPLPVCRGSSKGRPGVVDPLYVAASRMVRDYTIVCPVVELLGAASRRTGGAAGATYLYYFVVTPSFSVNVPSAYLPEIGAFHGAEVPFVFNDTFELLSAPERALSAAMGCFWANFAATGDPNRGPGCGSGAPSPLPRWPAWSPEGGVAIVFNSTVGVEGKFAARRCAALAGVPHAAPRARFTHAAQPN